MVKNAVLGMAEKRSPELATHGFRSMSAWVPWWIALFLPATEESLAEITELGVADPCAISCEPFISG